MEKQRLYFDMDNVLVDFSTGIAKLSDDVKKNMRGALMKSPAFSP